MVTAINHSSAAQNTAAASSASAVANATDKLANKDVFLKLLVEQIKHQDPLNPQDGTQFVAQLAQFSQLEQSSQMRNDLDAIKASVGTPTAVPAVGSKAPGSGSPRPQSPAATITSTSGQ